MQESLDEAIRVRRVEHRWLLCKDVAGHCLNRLQQGIA
jgi:hypothetical protein